MCVFLNRKLPEHEAFGLVDVQGVGQLKLARK